MTMTKGKKHEKGGSNQKKTILDEDTNFGKKADIVNKYLRQTK